MVIRYKVDLPGLSDGVVESVPFSHVRVNYSTTRLVFTRERRPKPKTTRTRKLPVLPTANDFKEFCQFVNGRIPDRLGTVLVAHMKQEAPHDPLYAGDEMDVD